MQQCSDTGRTNSFTEERELLFRCSLKELGYRLAQAVLDIVVSSAAVIIALPLLLIIAVMIKVDSPGPVIFKHTRTGLNRRVKGQSNYGGIERRQKDLFGKQFTLYKFRTMYADSQSRFPELYAYNYSREELESLPIKVLVGRKDNPRGSVDVNVAFNDDPRITPVGRWLRKTSLDELPNFFNVLKGDMHLVGPRPDMAANIQYYSEAHLKVLDVKPGVTGLAQVTGRGKLSFMQINDYDLEYVNNRSLLLDLKILLKTFVVCFKGEGAC